jgi:glucose-1-phosphate thymidylyltransferase
MGIMVLDMKGVILSGGKGTRLAPITLDYPKQLLPVMGKPIIYYTIDYLLEAGVNEIGIVVSKETGPLVEEAVLKKNFPATFKFIYQAEPLGLAHAIGLTKGFIEEKEDFVVLLGDNLFDKKLSSLIKTFKDTDASSLVLLKEVDTPQAFGVVKFDAESGRAKQLVEKPKTFVSKYAIVGVYLFKYEIFEAISALNPSSRGELEITDAIAAQVELGQNVQTSLLDSFWYDTGTLPGLITSNKRLLIANKNFDNRGADVRDSILLGGVQISEGCSIHNCNIMGPVYIGPNTKLKNCIIGPFTSISENNILEDTEIQQSLLMQNCHIENTKIVSSFVYKDTKVINSQMILDQIFNGAKLCETYL